MRYSLYFFICRSWTLLTLVIQVTSSAVHLEGQRKISPKLQAHGSDYLPHMAVTHLASLVRACVVIDAVSPCKGAPRHRCECVRDEER